MSTEIVLTGTGYPRPHPERAGPGVLVRHDDTVLQVDAGRGTVMRLAALGVSCRQVTAVLVTHHHSDHLVALPDMALTRWIARDPDTEDTPLEVVVPEGPSARFVERMLEPWKDDIAVRAEQTGRPTRPEVRCHPFAVPEVNAVQVWSTDRVRVLALAVHHEPVHPAVAYRIETPDGVVIVSGDTRACEEVARLAEGADVVVHEVIRTSAVSGSFAATVTDYHADSVELGRVMAGTGVPLLVLTHIIPAPDSPEDEQALAAEVRGGGYRGEVWVGRDLMRVELPRAHARPRP